MLVTGYKISNEFKQMDLALIHQYLSKSYWAAGIPLEIFESAAKNSLCFGVFTDSGAQVGFARVITDTATFAYLADVFILQQYRGKGLSKYLMQEILQHPELQGLRRMVLATKDAHGLYEKFGFRALANPQTFMELWRPDIYVRR